MIIMNKIVEIKFGSHLYGTATENSDLDLKSIYIPTGEDIILQRIKKSICNKRSKNEGEKNLPGEIDEECYSFDYYLKLLLEGQTVALDMLFANEESILNCHPLWRIIVKNKSKFLSKKSASFVGYCRQQANKYGIKGSRVASVRDVLNKIDNAIHFKLKTIGQLKEEWEVLAQSVPHIKIIDMIQPDKKTIIKFVEVVGKQFSYTTDIKIMRDCLQKIMDGYGNRALLAEENKGIDWKALSHAVRVANQAVELFETGNVIFPLINREHILAIKTARVPYNEVGNEIESLLEIVEEASLKSSLTDKPDYEFAENLILSVYSKECFDAFCRSKVDYNFL